MSFLLLEIVSVNENAQQVSERYVCRWGRQCCVGEDSFGNEKTVGVLN